MGLYSFFAAVLLTLAGVVSFKLLLGYKFSREIALLYATVLAKLWNLLVLGDAFCKKQRAKLFRDCILY